MKTTLDLPDELMCAVKIRAAEENRKLKEIIADLLRRGLAQPPGGPPTARQRVGLPLVQCTHEARPGEEMTPERVAELLAEEEVGGGVWLCDNNGWLDAYLAEFALAGGYRMVTTDTAFRQFSGLDLVLLGHP